MFVIKISAYYDWSATYVIPKPTEEEAKQIAFHAAKSQFSCVLPDTLEEFENSDDLYMEILADDAELMIQEIYNGYKQ